MSKKILIVEDNEVNLDIFQEIFEDNYELKMVTDGLQALEVIEKFMPRLVLLDVMMENIDGYEVCEKIRSNEKLNDVIIIMVSARAMESDRKKGLEVGANEYITKPFEEEVLLEMVNSYIN